MIAVVGDVHNQWEWEDNTCLQALGVDLALFVGDFGNEAVTTVERVAGLQLPKAVIFGNHDAHYSASKRGRKKCPYDPTKEDRVQQQLDLLGEHHVGYGKRDFEQFHLSIVGSRPFSWGGPKWRNEEFYRQRYGITGFSDSTERIMSAVKETAYPTTIFLGHNGPIGLGDKPYDLCGRDWKPSGGDYGDRDLADAIAQTRAFGKHIPLVTFGHMHHKLKNTDEYQRTAVIKDEQETVYFNAACVPRIVETDDQRWRKFFLVSLTSRGVDQIRLVWVGEDGAIAQEEIYYEAQRSIALKILRH